MIELAVPGAAAEFTPEVRLRMWAVERAQAIYAASGCPYTPKDVKAYALGLERQLLRSLKRGTRQADIFDPASPALARAEAKAKGVVG